MRKVRWAAAAAGAVLLIAGCGSEGDAAQGHGGDAPSAGGSAPAKAESGGSLDVAAVKKEIGAAATAAGFTEKPRDDVPPVLKSCTVRWQSDGAKATDSRKSYDATVATLVNGGWQEGGSNAERQSVIKVLDKTGWRLIASHRPQGWADGTDEDSFIFVDTGPACEKPFKEDLADKTTNKK
ncbi:hypothetical protein ACFV30_39705 [Streptomyces sp. NPDC059752]|uniref:hypothetical protein n=1 Tax=unclassified Streptomyces TaxID=2593676 RepID=UPI0036659C0F